MSVPLHRASIAVQPPPRTHTAPARLRTESNTFKNQVASALDQPAKAVKSEPAAEENTATANAASVPDWRQIFGLGAKSAAAGPEKVADSNLEQVVPEEPAQPSTPLDVLNAALLNAGIDPNSLDMVAHDEIAYYPGGGWINHLITVTTPGGKTENYSADLVAKMPNVAALEIQHLMELG